MCPAPNRSGSRVSRANVVMWAGAPRPGIGRVSGGANLAGCNRACVERSADGCFGEAVWPCYRVGPNPPFKRTPAGGPALRTGGGAAPLNFFR